MGNKMLLTKEGYEKLKNELTDLSARRDQLVTRLEEVAQPDESCEDGLASQLKEELELVNDKIDKLEEVITTAQIISGKSTNSNVQIGSKVTIKLTGNAKKEFHIVSEMEADPALNKISDQSPLGQAMLGKRVDDEIEFEAPIGKMIYKIVSIN